MKPARAVADAASRLGLDVDWESISQDAPLVISRAECVVTVQGADLFAESAPDSAHIDAAWFLLGLRLGLDKIRPEVEAQAKTSPLQFRRTPVKRYHEAPSFHGEHLPLLVPSMTRRTFEAVSHKRAFHRPGLLENTEVLIVCETGTRLDILTVDEQENSAFSDELRWSNARTALFYNSFKLKPRQTIALPGGSLRIFETTEGLGASRALLLPELDYDAAQDGGFLALPTRDRIIIARPDDKDSASSLLPRLREEIGAAMSQSAFPFADAILQLSAVSVAAHEESTLNIGAIADPVEGRVIDEANQFTGP